MGGHRILICAEERFSDALTYKGMGGKGLAFPNWYMRRNFLIKMLRVPRGEPPLVLALLAAIIN